MDIKINKVESHNDKRGKLIVLLKYQDLPSSSKKFGEVFYITFSKRGTTRANHYHKNWREWFIVVSGKIKVVLEDIKTKERKKLTLDAQSHSIKRLEIGPFVAHSFTSLSKHAVLLNYSNKVWIKKDVIPYIIGGNTKNQNAKKD